MNTILWNTSKKKLEAMYDSRIYTFAPDEKKIYSNNSEYDKTLINHLIFHLECYGMVSITEGATGEEIKKAYVKGVTNRWKQMDFLCRNFKEMNMERAANKMSAALPGDQIFEAAKEAKLLLTELRNLEKEKFEAIDDYLNDSKTEQAQELLAGQETEIETSGLHTTIKKGKK